MSNERPTHERSSRFPNDAGTTGAARDAVPPRPQGWDEPGPEPILDAARVPLSVLLKRRSRASAIAYYAWLRFVRPLLVIVFWVGVVFYSYRHFFGPTDSLDDYQLLGVYALSVLIIFVMMLVLAPLRASVDQGARTDKPVRHNTGRAVAVYTDVAAEQLSDLQHARRVVVLHDDNGRLRGGVDLDRGPHQPPVAGAGQAR